MICIIDAFLAVPRDLFVLGDFAESAYLDIALPIVGGSTISQPTTVAMMLEALEPKSGEKVLEIGTGSGWQACLLSRCVGRKGSVVTIEINQGVADFAKSNIGKIKPSKVKTVVGDGSAGYPKEAPYNKIIYTAAAPSIPQEVISQLAVGGRLVAPVGSLTMQIMKIVDRASEKKVNEREIGTFQFVPLQGKRGF